MNNFRFVKKIICNDGDVLAFFFFCMEIDDEGGCMGYSINSP